jgi:hypothetical protein
MKKFLLATVVAFAFAAPSAPAFALVDLCFDPNQSCGIDNEAKIFLDKAKNVLSGTGHVGSQTGLPVVLFQSHDHIDLFDLANGFATIKPSDGKNLTGLDITVPGHTFGDFLWDAQMTNNKNFSDFGFTAQGFLGGILQDSFVYTGLGHDTDLSFGVLGLDGGQIDELRLFSASGFKELKHFQISGIDGLTITPTSGVPEPSTWAMGIAGFGFMALMGWRRHRQTLAAAA